VRVDRRVELNKRPGLLTHMDHSLLVLSCNVDIVETIRLILTNLRCERRELS
jgi:hypothetical protein